jgi:putative lipoic acid-binding regulatory protein
MKDNRPSEELLQSNHLFPGTYQIKAIGASADDFAARVVAAAALELATPAELDHSIRQTPDGRHVSVTLDVTVQTAAQVRAIYARIQEVEGLALLF